MRKNYEIKCKNCGYIKCDNFYNKEKIKKCMDASVFTGIMNYNTQRKNKKLVHFSCLLNDEKGEGLEPIPVFPIIEGLEILMEGFL